MGMHHLGHVYLPRFTAYQFIHAPLDLYAIQWKLGLGGGGCHSFCHQVVCPAEALPAGTKAANRLRNTVEEHVSDTM